jgi:hypothetical protein
MVRRQQDADRAVRAPMRSPGAPPHQREVQRLFWIEIAKGVLPAEAAIAVGASQPVGQRWFHNAGGMPPFDLQPLSGRYLSFREREEIALLNAQGAGVERHRPRHRSGPGHDLARATTQCRHPCGQFRVSGLGRSGRPS